MDKYYKPEIKTYTASDLIEIIGPTQAASTGSVTVTGGGSAMLNTSHKAEYRFVKADINYGVITKKEVTHA